MAGHRGSDDTILIVERSWFRVLAGAVIGIAVALWTYGLAFFDGDAAMWRLLWGDAGTGLAALRYYIDQPWGMPLLHADVINSPDGINIAFTDSLPILAMVAKAVKPLGVSAEQWFAWWYLMVFALQGAAAVTAVRAWGVRSWVIELSAAVLAVSMPILTLRTWHPGLAAQYTLLLAWAAVGHLRRSERQTLVLGLATALSVVALLSHVYLLLGVSMIVGGAAVGEAVRGRLELRRLFGWIGVHLATVLGVAGVCGYFSAGAEATDGYMDLGMHLLNPFWPQRSWFWPGNEWIIEASGSFEPFNWLGMGTALLVLGALAVGVRQLPTIVRRYQVLCAFMLVLVLYSLTPTLRIRDDNPHDARTVLARMVTNEGYHNEIYGLGSLSVVLATIWWLSRRPGRSRDAAGVAVLATALGLWSAMMLVSTWPLEEFTSQFRVAGRFFWPVSYGLVIGSLVAASRSRQRWMPALVVALVIVQVIDIQDYREQAHDVFLPELFVPVPDREETLGAMAEAMHDFDRVHLEPPLNCVPGFTNDAWAVFRFQDVGIVASWERQEIDAVYAARRALVDCNAPITFVEGDDVVNMVVVATGTEATSPVPEEFGCRPLFGLMACSTRWVDEGRDG